MKSGISISTRHSIDWVLFYTTAISVTGLLVLIAAQFNLPEDRFGFGLFALMIAVAEFGNVELFHSSRGSTVSVSMVVTVAAILAFGPITGVQLQIVGGLVATAKSYFLDHQAETKNRAPWYQRSAFNVGMYVLSTAAAGGIFMLTGSANTEVLQPINLIRLPLLAATDTFVNIFLLLVVISLQTRQSLLEIWQQDFAWSVPISIISGVIGGGLLALAYQKFGFLGTSVFFLPIFAMGYSFRLYTNNMRNYVDKLETANAELNKNNIDLLETLGAVIDAYDIYTLQHSAHVAEYAGALADKLGLTEDERKTIVKAALVHDIGKIGVSDTIVGKAGSLTDHEMVQIRRHPIMGANILRRMKGFQDLIPLVQYHHEKFNGTGYPEGLKGEAIPLGARIITLADSVDAMSSDRPYRPGHSLEEVVAEVKRCAGTHFDARIVEAFLLIVDEKGPAFFKIPRSPRNRKFNPPTAGRTWLGR